MTRRASPLATPVSAGPVLQIAIDAPVMRPFDYLPPPKGSADIQRGQRVLVPFRAGERVGVVLGIHATSAVPAARLRCVLRTLDEQPLLDEPLMALLDWVAAYYQHPPGEVYAAALPRLLRHGRDTETGEVVWHATGAGREAHGSGLGARAPLQARLLAALVAAEWGLNAAELRSLATGWAAGMKALEQKGWAGRLRADDPAPLAASSRTLTPPQLTEAQESAVTAITKAAGYQTFLLEGVTGSGKTEVYLRCIEQQLAAGRQSLVLVPEIGLTPQLVGRFRQRFPAAVSVVLHSGLTDRQRLEAWLRSREGRAQVVIGTRSAVFVPLPRPGLIVVDEEHDGSFKQHEGLRYSARDVAVWRAYQLGVSVILGSATPSLESLANADAGRYRRLQLPQRAGLARPPEFRLVDLRRHVATDGLSPPLTAAIARHLAAQGQVLLFLNRRGFAPTLLCPGCGHCVECRRCDARMVLHRGRNRVICHHCGSEREAPSACPDCGGELYAVGQGTERLEAALAGMFPECGIVRVDRDTTRGRGQIEQRLMAVTAGQAQILVGTQMLTKGHDFPGVTLVGIVDADQGLFGTDFRASERLAQTVVQVAGRAGRGDRPGEVYIQTLFPEHPLLTVLIRDGYDRFAEQALRERRAAGWPPYAYLALLRAEANQAEPVQAFLGRARQSGDELSPTAVRLLGPAAAPMERRAGRYRAQLLVQTGDRARLQQFLAAWRAQFAELAEARRVRWSLDVDPVELF